MLARHLLFLATRRPHNALLVFSSDSTPTQGIPQFPPPPYILPPQPQEWRLHQDDINKSIDRNTQDSKHLHSHNNIPHHRISHDPRHFIGRKPVFMPNQYYTLPNRKSPGDMRDPIRCVTPDITRGLGKQQDNSVVDRKSLQQNAQQLSAPVDSRNRFFAPLGLSALGYRFFASSPHESQEKSTTDGPNHPNVSPITTKPSARSNPTVAQRLSTLAGSPCAYSTPSLATKDSNSDTASVASSSGRATPTNLLLSPGKSTMSNEELFTAIHKSKRKLNIKNDNEVLSNNTCSLDRGLNQTGTRHSWSPESHNVPEVPPTPSIHSPTSRMDFKRLLLQQSTKMGPNRLSAAEQLKLSRQHCQQQQHQSRSNHQQLQTPSIVRALSPRSVWRFQTPRSDVLSSTIVEDTAAEERAMKLSPENQHQNGRIKSRRQLDMCSISPIQKSANYPQISHYREIQKRNFNSNSQLNSILGNNNSSDAESRRARNQRARAEFLAGSASKNSDNHYFAFRARSESPKHPSGNNTGVTRSPSAPTLETAL